MAANYRPLTWTGANWSVAENGQGGQPGITVADGQFKAGVRGPWSGPNMSHQRTAALVFIATKSGLYRITGAARSKPWEGGAKIFRLSIRKKDTQRAAELKLLELPHDASPVALDLKIELTAGHELLFLPLMPDWHNATTPSIEDLKISLEEPGEAGR